MIESFTVSRDDGIYEAFPDVALTASGKLVCVFAECNHHGDRSYTCVMVTESSDRGRSWSAKRALTVPLRWSGDTIAWWNCPRITALTDGRLVAVVDYCEGHKPGEPASIGVRRNLLFVSRDDGQTWDGPHETPVRGIVPDRLIELKRGEHAGRWVMSAHIAEHEAGGSRLFWQRAWYSDDQGESWEGPVTIAHDPGLKLCEGSTVEMPAGELVCFLRENSGRGWDMRKAVSRDGGETWDGPCPMPVPGCHRPVGGVLQSGRVLITHRYVQGGKGWTADGSFSMPAQNLLAALTTVEGCLSENRDGPVRLRPIDHDRSPNSDIGYSGWVQFEDGEIYIVSYLVDEAPNGHIRGYALSERDIVLD